ncbi:hypothetical protein FM107_08130 [Sphingobacterium sp. JB170]|nr:hypothetical protein FM107_08130 [Sphingobacterium sp. JB170]
MRSISANQKVRSSVVWDMFEARAGEQKQHSTLTVKNNLAIALLRIELLILKFDNI